MDKNKEPLPDKKLVKDGRKWHSKFHFGLGYRICEDDYDLQALSLTMKDINKEAKSQTLKQVRKIIEKYWKDDFYEAKNLNEYLMNYLNKELDKIK